jgi:hypothetical protein
LRGQLSRRASWRRLLPSNALHTHCWRLGRAHAAPAGDKLANGTAEIPAGYAYDFAAGARRLAGQHPASAGGTCVLLGDDASLLHTAAAAAKASLRCRALVSRLEPG